jgi:hypothetical protein
MLTVELLDSVNCKRTTDKPGRETITAPKGRYTVELSGREYILRPIRKSDAPGPRYLLTVSEFDKLRANGTIIEHTN